MTCIGNSGPLSDDVSKQITEGDLAVAAVASSNRNFEGRIHPLVKTNYLMSPPLVVCFAIAGRVDIDMTSEPLASVDGKDIYLKDIWPSDEEVKAVMDQYVTKEAFAAGYDNIYKGSDKWNSIECSETALFGWDKDSTYIRNPPYFEHLADEPEIKDIEGGRCLAKLGDSITTDHISPAGAFGEKSSAGQYLISLGVQKKDFNSYGSRRANHEIMVRGTFANVRLRNQLVPGTEGGYSKYVPDGSVDYMYETSEKYRKDGSPLIVLAGKDYGMGSSRDWAAKGPLLLGVKAVIAESFERIHRSNLVGMGIVPLQFRDGENADELELDGTETFDIDLSDLSPKKIVSVLATKQDGTMIKFDTICRADVPVEIEYIANGGILPFVLRRMIAE